MTVPGQIDNLTTSEVDKVISYLTPNIAAGQVKAFWPDYGTSVILMTSGEVLVADIWNAAVFSSVGGGNSDLLRTPEGGSRPLGWR